MDPAQLAAAAASHSQLAAAASGVQLAVAACSSQQLAAEAASHSQLADAVAAAAAFVAPVAREHPEAAEARRLAELEGLQLERSDSNTGFIGVSWRSNRTKAFAASIWQGGKLTYVGTAFSAEGAALIYQRAKQQRELCDPHMMTAEQAEMAAAEEGLTLERDSSGGLMGVLHRCFIKNKPYESTVWRGGKQRSLGHFATPEEAALACARAKVAEQQKLAQKATKVLAAKRPRASF